MVKVNQTYTSSGSTKIAVNINPSESSNAQITTVKFDGTNYLAWSQPALLYISSKDEEKYLTQEMTIPNPSDPTYCKWKTEKCDHDVLVLTFYERWNQ